MMQTNVHSAAVGQSGEPWNVQNWNNQSSVTRLVGLGLCLCENRPGLVKVMLT